MSQSTKNEAMRHLNQKESFIQSLLLARELSYYALDATGAIFSIKASGADAARRWDF